MSALQESAFLLNPNLSDIPSFDYRLFIVAATLADLMDAAQEPEPTGANARYDFCLLINSCSLRGYPPIRHRERGS